MQSKMTEGEFRAAVVQRAQGCGFSDASVAVAREAGLEFAPEPSPLPAKVLTGPCVPSGVWIGPSSGGPLLQGPNESALLAEALATRYNAYSGLLSAAQDFFRLISEDDDVYMTDQYAALESALRVPK